MRSRVPPDAFATYLAMGEKRSYAALAKQIGVSKAAITNRAVKEDWAAKLADAEKASSQKSEARAMETLEEMTERHIKIVRGIQSRAWEALRSMPIQSASAAVRALVEGVKLECLLRGQPSERTAVSVEDVVKKEYATWFAPVTEDGSQQTSSSNAGTEGGERDDDRDDDNVEA